MSLKEWLRTRVQAELSHVTDQLASHAPYPGLRASVVPPTPRQAEEALRQLRRNQRIGEPDIHFGGWPPYGRP